MKKIIFLLAILSFANAQEDCGVANLSDRSIDDCRNVDIFANALYWRASEPIDWCYTLAVSVNFEQVDFKTIAFHWEPGFRIGVGYNMEYDEWDTQAMFTWFRTQTKDTNTGSITSPFFGSKLALFNAYESAKINWKLQTNIIDWDLGRKFWVSSYLSLRPSIGIRGGWIDQAIVSHWQNPLVSIPGLESFRVFLTATEKLKNNFFGGGPKGGISAKWVLGNLCSCFMSLFADFSAAYMWGNWTLRDEFRDDDIAFSPLLDIRIPDFISVKTGNRNFGAFEMQGLIGIAFDFNFNCDRSHLAFKAGYEIQDWFKQYQLFDNLTSYHFNDLVIQGLTVDVRLDF